MPEITKPENVQKIATNPEKTVLLFSMVFISLIITATTFFVERAKSLSSTSEISATAITTEIQGNPQFSTIVETRWQHLLPSTKIENGTSVLTKKGETAEISLPDNGMIRIGETSEVRIFFTDSQSKNIIIQIITGKIHVNNQFSATNINIQSPGLLLIPQNAIFNASIDSSQAEIQGLSGSTLIGLTDPTKTFDHLINFTDREKFINSFLLVSGNQTIISKNKISSQLQPLLYSKLVKEFNYGKIPQAKLQEEWAKSNLEKAAGIRQQLISKEIERITRRGLKNKEIPLGSGTFESFGKHFIFSDKKITEKYFEDLFTLIEDSEYLLLTNQTPQAKSRLAAFTRQIDFLKQETGAENLSEELKEKFRFVQAIPAGHLLYPVKQTILNSLFSSLMEENRPEEAFFLLRTQLYEAFAIADENLTLASEGFSKYSQNLQKLLQKYSATIIDPTDLEEENQIMGQLIGNYPVLFKDEVFEIKSILESAWLQLLPDGPDLREEKQTLILAKIRLLEKLQAYFLDEKIAVQNAKDAVLRLTRDIEKLQDPLNQTAVQQIFREMLKDFNSFWRYLNSPEYSSPTTGLSHGKTHRERYTKFQKTLGESEKISALGETLLGVESAEKPVAPTTEEILNKAKKELELAGLREVTLEPEISPDGTSVIIKNALFVNYQIKAQYDRQRQIISKINLDGKLVSGSGVKLNQFQTFITAYTATPEKETITAVPQPVETENRIEKTAKILVQNKLQQNNISVSQENIIIIDLNSALFAVQNVSAGTLEDPITLKFQFISRTNSVQNLEITTNYKTQKVSGPLSLQNINLLEYARQTAKSVEESTSSPTEQ